MNNPKEGKGVITTLANKINVIDLDNTKDAIASVNEVENKYIQAKLRKAIEKRSQKIEDEHKEKINPYELGKEAKEYMENKEMERE